MASSKGKTMFESIRRFLNLAILGIVYFSGNAIVSSVNAAIVFTQDQTAFSSATAGFSFVTETFNSVPTGNLGTSESFSGFTINSNGDMFGQNFAFFCLVPNCISFSNSNAPYSFTFDSPISALGFFIGDGGGDTSDFKVDGVSVGTITTPLGEAEFTFVGVYDPVGSFTVATVVDRMGFHELEDLSFSLYSSVPESGTLALFGLGLAGLGYTRRKRPA